MPEEMGASPSRRASRLLSAGLFAAGAALLLLYVLRFGVNVPINDDWDHVITSLRWMEEGIRADTLFAPHNEHRLAVPRLWNHLVLRVSRGNFRLLLLLHALLGCAGLALCLHHLQTWRAPPRRWLLPGLAAALGFSAWGQWQTFLWPFQFPYFLLPLLVLGGSLLLIRDPNNARAFFGTALILWTAALSNGNGLFAVWALLPALVTRGRQSPAWRRAHFVNLLAVTLVFAAMLPRGKNPELGGFHVLREMPGEALRLGLALLGSPLDPAGVFAGRLHPATAAGALSLGLAALCAWRYLRPLPADARRNLSPALGLMIYGSLSLLAVVYSRTAMMVETGIESRYLTFAISWWLGLLMAGTGISLADPSGYGRVLRTLLTAGALWFCAATLASMPLFWAHGHNMRAALERHQEVYRHAREPEWREELRSISRHFGPERIGALLEGMERHGLLHPDLAPPPGP